MPNTLSLPHMPLTGPVMIVAKHSRRPYSMTMWFNSVCCAYKFDSRGWDCPWPSSIHDTDCNGSWICYQITYFGWRDGLGYGV